MTTTQAPIAPAEPTTAAPAPRTRGPLARAWGYLLGTGSHVVLIIWAAIVTLPLVWAVLSSFKTDVEILSEPLGVPATPQLDNYARAWSGASIADYFLNTIIVSVSALALTLAVGSLMAFVLAKFRFPGRGLIMGAMVAAMTFPIVLALVPLFFIVNGLGLSNTYLGMVLAYTAFALPFTVFFLTGFFSTIADEFVDAARIDGCGYWRAFVLVVLPLARPGLISIGIINFLGMWNQYLLPLVLATDRSKYVLTQGLANLAVEQGYASDWGALFAGLMIATFPVLIVYILFQRHIKSGLAAGGVKQ